MVQFLVGVLDVSPEWRWTPFQASHHSFVTDSRYDASFKPPELKPAQDDSVAHVTPPPAMRFTLQPPQPLPWSMPSPSVGADSAGTFSSNSDAGSAPSNVSRRAVKAKAKAPSVCSRPMLSSATATPTSASSPHGSTDSRSTAPRAPTGFGHTPHGHQTQSRSPWHLPSPGYSASDCSGGETRPATWNDSQSGSQSNFESDPWGLAMSDGSAGPPRSGQQSDSDSTGCVQDQVKCALWKNVQHRSEASSNAHPLRLCEHLAACEQDLARGNEGAGLRRGNAGGRSGPVRGRHGSWQQTGQQGTGAFSPPSRFSDTEGGFNSYWTGGSQQEHRRHTRDSHGSSTC